MWEKRKQMFVFLLHTFSFFHTIPSSSFHLFRVISTLWAQITFNIRNPPGSPVDVSTSECKILRPIKLDIKLQFIYPPEVKNWYIAFGGEAEIYCPRRINEIFHSS